MHAPRRRDDLPYTHTWRVSFTNRWPKDAASFGHLSYIWLTRSVCSANLDVVISSFRGSLHHHVRYTHRTRRGCVAIYLITFSSCRNKQSGTTTGSVFCVFCSKSFRRRPWRASTITPSQTPCWCVTRILFPCTDLMSFLGVDFSNLMHTTEQKV